MSVPCGSDPLDELLLEACGQPAPQPDFSEWERTHPEAVRELKSAACQPAGVGAGRSLPLRLGVWIMKNRYAGVAVAGAAVVLVAAVAIWPHGDNEPNAGSGAVSGPDRLAALSRGSTVREGASSGAVLGEFRERTLADYMQGAGVIVRVKMLAVEKTDLLGKVTKVIYGLDPGEQVRADRPIRVELKDVASRLARDLDREPTDAEVYAEVCRDIGFRPDGDAILFLRRGCDDVVVGSPEKLDQVEQELIDLLKKGRNLTAVKDDLGSLCSSTEQTVWAKVEKIGPDSATWRVLEVLGVFEGHWWQRQETAGKPPPRRTPATIAVDLQPWRLRAKAIVRYQAGREQGTPVTKEAVQQEFERLVNAELKPGQEAILFLTSAERAKAEHDVRAILYKAQQPSDFDHLKQGIREMFKTRRFQHDVRL